VCTIVSGLYWGVRTACTISRQQCCKALHGREQDAHLVCTFTRISGFFELCAQQGAQLCIHRFIGSRFSAGSGVTFGRELLCSLWLELALVEKDFCSFSVLFTVANCFVGFSLFNLFDFCSSAQVCSSGV
jgi:hypothetical protein